MASYLWIITAVNVQSTRGDEPQQLALRGFGCCGCSSDQGHVLLETAKINGLEPHTWLSDVLKRLPSLPAESLHRGDSKTDNARCNAVSGTETADTVMLSPERVHRTQ